MYKLVSDHDSNSFEPLQSTTFDLAAEEALATILQWYILDEGDRFVAVSDNDSNDCFELDEQSYEDAQYEAINRLGYYITELEKA